MICPTERSAFPEDVPASSANHVTALPHRLTEPFARRAAGYSVPPRDTGMSAPEMPRDAGDARKRIRSAIAAGWTNFEKSASGISARLVGVSMMVGNTALTVQDVSASSAARASVILCTAVLDAA